MNWEGIMPRFNLALLMVIAMLGIGSSVAAQPRYSQVLVGKWEGELRLQSSRSNPARTLIIESVGEGDVAIAVKGKYGTTGNNLGRITATLETSGGQARLRFTTSANSNVVLDLQGDRDLVGTITLSGGEARDMRLKKVE
jgi:hypothetical protein